MSEIVLSAHTDDVHLRWMREAMHMVGGLAKCRIHRPLTGNLGRRGNRSQGGPSRLRLRSRRQNNSESP